MWPATSAPSVPFPHSASRAVPVFYFLMTIAINLQRHHADAQGSVEGILTPGGRLLARHRRRSYTQTTLDAGVTPLHKRHGYGLYSPWCLRFTAYGGLPSRQRPMWESRRLRSLLSSLAAEAHEARGVAEGPQAHSAVKDGEHW